MSFLDPSRLGLSACVSVVALAVAACGGTVVFEEDGGSGDGGSGSGKGSANAATGQTVSTAGSGAGSPTATTAPASVNVSTGGATRPSAEEICALFCDCQGCGNSDRRECVESSQTAIDDADGRGCGPELDAYLDCFFNQSVCVNGQVELDGCEDTLRGYDDCIGRTR